MTANWRAANPQNNELQTTQNKDDTPVHADDEVTYHVRTDYSSNAFPNQLIVG